MGSSSSDTLTTNDHIMYDLLRATTNRNCCTNDKKGNSLLQSVGLLKNLYFYQEYTDGLAQTVFERRSVGMG